MSTAYMLIREGQEWEKQGTSRMGSTRIRILKDPGTSSRVEVGTVTAGGRVIRKREILVSALNNAPSGYVLVKSVPEAKEPMP